jgi:putative acetyltransferase
VKGVAATITEATIADAPAMSALMRRTVRASNAGDYSRDVVAHLLDELSPDNVGQRMEGRNVFVTCEDGAIIGTASFGIAAGKLHSMFVEPTRQKSGIGRALVAHLERHARSKGYKEIVVSSSLTARAFYEKLGYVSLNYEDKPGAATWFMKKGIADA